MNHHAQPNDCSCCVLTWWRTERGLEGSPFLSLLIKAEICYDSSTLMTKLQPKDPTTGIMTLWVRVSIYKLGGKGKHSHNVPFNLEN